jgi:TPR repeat protein
MILSLVMLLLLQEELAFLPAGPSHRCPAGVSEETVASCLEGLSMSAARLHRWPACLLLAALLCPPIAWGAEPARGRKHALLVGVRDYASGKFDPLRFTENDAEDLAGVLRDTAGFTVRVLSTTRGKSKASDAPTAANIRAAIEKLLADRRRDDTVLVALSGHGIQGKVKDSEDNFFCPADAQLNDTTRLLSLSRLVKDLDGCGAGVKLLLVDACRNDPAVGRSVDLDSLPRPPRGTAVLFSCKSGERAFETPKLGHGVFFHHVIRGLKGEARNKRGEVTWSSLADHVIENVSDDVPRLIREGAKQTPHKIENLTGKSPVLVRISEADRLFRLAQEHYYGQGRRTDYVEAARLYERAANAGHPLAGGQLAVCYAIGIGVKKNEARARTLGRETIPAVRGAAEKGSAVAQDLLGSMHCHGLGVAKDHAEALHWYRKAADQGHASAQSNLGGMYAYGRGVAKDYAEAVRWFRVAADQNHASAQYNLGAMYATGRGVAKDPAEAVRWFRKAAEQGHARGQYSLGLMYANGHGVEKDYPEALRWYRKAAEQNFAEAQFNLGVMYEKGQGVETDHKEAVRWYRKAADQGHASAQYNLGVMFANGDGVAKDEAEAVRWYRKAAEQNHAWAQASLGNMHRDGRGVERDYAEALRWYRKATEQNHAWAQASLGYMYEQGRGVERDLDEARRWYRKAADQGDEYARKRLAKLK